MTIRTKQFQLLTDAELAWELMTDVFTPDECNGPAAPFFEYALASSWQDKTYLRLNRFWLDGDKPVGFLFYEDDPNRLHFVLRPGYEALAGEMIDYGETAFPAFGEPRELVLNQGQKALIEAAEARGYKVVDREEYKVFDFRTGQLSRPLPSGYHFVDPAQVNPLKAARCMWEGFNEGRGPFTGWEIPVSERSGRLIGPLPPRHLRAQRGHRRRGGRLRLFRRHVVGGEEQARLPGAPVHRPRASAQGPGRRGPIPT